MPMSVADISGQRFGRLKVLNREPNPTSVKSRWKCMCVCGKITTVFGFMLKSGRTKSCGCLHSEIMTKHGCMKHPLYCIWKSMKQRCSPSAGKDKQKYYYRGIRVCAEWRTDFLTFSNWANTNGWGPDLELDRRNNDGNYCPENCRFVTRSVNAANRRKRASRSGYTGIVLHKPSNQWRADITASGIRHYLGYYDIVEDAVTARNNYIVENNLAHPVQEIITRE